MTLISYSLFTFILLFNLNLRAQSDSSTSVSDQESIGLIAEVINGGIDPTQFLNHGCQQSFSLERPSEYQSSQCNPLIEETFEKTQNWSLYSLFHRERPYNECTSQINFENISMPQVQRNLAQATGQGGMFTNLAFQCQESIGNTDEDYNEQTLMLEATHGLTQLRIESMAKRSLQGLNKIDTILGRSLISNSISCDNEISQDVGTLCESYSSCGTPSNNSDSRTRRRPRVHFHAQMTLEALKASREFDKMIDDLKVQKRRIGTNGPRGTRRLNTSQQERADELDFMIEDLTNNKADVLSTVPWINGLKFKENINSIEDELEKIDSLSDEEHSIRKSQLENSLISDIGGHLVEQLSADKEELLRRYDVAKQSARCLHTGQECRRFEENMEMAPPVDLGLHFNTENPNELFTKRLMEAGQCLEQRRASVSTYNRVAVDVASIGAGFLMGGAGGLVRLASVAGRLYVRGNRLRALGAGAVLALEGAAIGSGVNDSINSCQNVRRNMSQFQEADSNYQCNNDSNQMTLMTNYKQCLTDVLLTSVGVIAGVAPDIARSIRSSRAVGLEDIAEKSADEILESFTGAEENSSHLRQALTNMNISPEEIADFKRVFNSSQEVFQDAKDTESFMVYFNHLSRKNQRAILDSMPDSLRSTPSANAIPRRAERLRLKWNRELSKINRLEDAAVTRATRIYRAEGKSLDEARSLATRDARVSRAQAQETRLGCRAPKMTAQHRAGATQFTNFSVAFGLGSTATSFSLANRDRPKDTEFLKDLGYELSMSYIMSKIGARIMSNPTGGIIRRYTQSNLQSSGVGIIDATIFANMYSLSTREAEERLERIKNSPQQVLALAKLDDYMQEEGVIQRIENSIMAQFRQSLESPETREYFLEEGVPIGDGSITGPLHISDLDDQEKAERIKRAVMMQFYNEQKGAAGTGTVFGDKFTYDRAYNAALGIPRAMAAGYMTYAALCRNAATPVRGLTQAFAIQALNQGFGGYYYYHFRKDYVGR